MSTGWETLPEIVLNRIFRNLDIVSKVSVRDVCQTWRRASCHPKVWKCCVYSEKPNTSPADYVKWKSCFRLFSDLIVHVHFEVSSEQSLLVLEYLLAVCRNILSFTLSKTIYGETPVFSDRLKEALCDFCEENTRVVRIRMENLNFLGVLGEPLPFNFYQMSCLRKLSLVNSFTICSLSTLMFLAGNLRELAINPGHACRNIKLIKILAQNSLQFLYIVVNKYTQEVDISKEEATRNSAEWNELRQCCSNFHVRYIYSNSGENIVLHTLCPSLPVAPTVFHRPETSIDWVRFRNSCITYGDSLEKLVIFNLRDEGTGHDYLETVDKQVLEIFRHCPKLSTFIINKTISSATLILLVFRKRQIQNFLIRDDMIEYSNDISDDVLQDTAAKDFVNRYWQKENFCRGISLLLNRVWHPLSKNDFRNFVQEKFSDFI